MKINREADDEFRVKLNKKSNELYYLGERIASVLHARVCECDAVSYSSIYIIIVSLNLQCAHVEQQTKMFFIISVNASNLLYFVMNYKVPFYL